MPIVRIPFKLRFMELKIETVELKPVYHIGIDLSLLCVEDDAWHIPERDYEMKQPHGADLYIAASSDEFAVCGNDAP